MQIRNVIQAVDRRPGQNRLTNAIHRGQFPIGPPTRPDTWLVSADALGMRDDAAIVDGGAPVKACIGIGSNVPDLLHAGVGRPDGGGRIAQFGRIVGRGIPGRIYKCSGLTP